MNTLNNVYEYLKIAISRYYGVIISVIVEKCFSRFQ